MQTQIGETPALQVLLGEDAAIQVRRRLPGTGVLAVLTYLHDRGRR